MKLLKFMSLAVLWFFLSHHAQGQYSESLMFGLRSGASYSHISNLPTILVSEDYYTGYSFSEKSLVFPEASLFVSYLINDSHVGLEGELSYWRYGTEIKYSDIKQFQYRCLFQYDYLGLGASFKGFLTKWLYGGLGLRFGFNLTDNHIFYHSNWEELDWEHGTAPLSDVEIQGELRDVIKGTNISELCFFLGCEFQSGLNFRFGYLYGINDAIETLLNRHDFIDSKNRINSLQLTVGWALPVDWSMKDYRKKR